MARLTIRNLAAALVERLRIRAAGKGRSMEAEFGAILNNALASDGDAEPNLADTIRRRVAPLGGVELEARPGTTIRNPPPFDR